MRNKLNLHLILCFFPLGPNAIADNHSLVENSRFLLDSRLRTEHAEQSGVDDATAVTLRARFGLATGPYRGLSLLVEGEHIEALGGETYNSTTNNRTRYATVADPSDTELNQAYLTYVLGKTSAQYGRMVVELDNERFIGDVGFRQNQQTYDAFMLQNTTFEGQRLRYAYMTKAHRFLGDDSPNGETDMRTHVLHYNYRRLNADQFSAYVHLIETQSRTNATRSHKNFGVRYQGNGTLGKLKTTYTVEFARQTDYADGASNNDANYARLDANLTFPNAWVAGLGYELLSGDGTYGFQTPLATGHAFNGYADVFAGSTPDAGLEDRFVNVKLPLAGAAIELVYHDYRSDEDNLDFGDELNVSITYQFAQRWEVGAKYADFNADQISTDTRRLWGWIQYSL